MKTPINSFMRTLAAIPVILLCAIATKAQTVFRGVLYSKIDSSVIPYAGISVKETGITVLTDNAGGFQIDVPPGIRRLTIAASAIGARDTFVYYHPFSKQEKLYLDITASRLNEFVVKSLSAEEVVQRAVAMIPVNYADSNYFDHSFYRRYQLVNGRYVNLMEAYPVVMFALTKTKNTLTSDEAFAVNYLRRTTYHPNVSNVIEDNPSDLLEVNPVYHLYNSSLNPMRFSSFRFRFDTAQKSQDYVIKYYCNDFSSDQHGIPDYDKRDLKAEAWETGELVIERGTFAIKKIHRVSHRHEDYMYKYFPPQNNYVRFNDHTYAFDFKGGDMVTEYKELNGKWYLDKIVRQYKDEFTWPGFESLEYTITDNFEWYSGFISRYTTGDYFDKFFDKMATAIRSYDTAFWDHEQPPFYYADKDVLYRDLQRDGPLLTQFFKETLVDKPAAKTNHLVALYGK